MLLLAYFSSFYFLFPAVLSQYQNIDEYNFPSYDSLALSDYSEITTKSTTTLPTTTRRKRIRKSRSPKIFSTTISTFFLSPKVPSTSTDYISFTVPTKSIIYSSSSITTLPESDPLPTTSPELKIKTDDNDDKKSDIPWYRCEKPERSGSSSSLDSYFITGFDYCNGECPRFEVICRTKSYEVRKYPETTWAYTTATSYSYNWASRQITRLHKYFNRENGLDTQLLMTSPVLTQIKEHVSLGSQITNVGKKKDYTILFYIPQAYHWYTPAPRDNKVQIMKLISQTIFALIPDELKTESEIEKTAERFKAQLQNNKEEFLNEYYYANFDKAGSITHHNEIWIPMRQGATAACEQYESKDFIDYGITNEIDDTIPTNVKNKFNDPTRDISQTQTESKEDKYKVEASSGITISHENNPNSESTINIETKNKQIVSGDVKKESIENDYDINISGVHSYDHESDTGIVQKVNSENTFINSVETRILNKPKPTLIPISKPSLKIVTVDKLGEAVQIHENDIVLEKGVKIIKTSTEKEKNGFEIGSSIKAGYDSGSNVGKDNYSGITVGPAIGIKSESGVYIETGTGINNVLGTSLQKDNVIGINNGKKDRLQNTFSNENDVGSDNGNKFSPRLEIETGITPEGAKGHRLDTDTIYNSEKNKEIGSRFESETGNIREKENGFSIQTDSRISPDTGTGTVIGKNGMEVKPGSENTLNGVSNDNKPESGSETGLGNRFKPGIAIGIKSGTVDETGKEAPTDSQKELASLLLKLNICSGDKCPTLNLLEFHRLGIQKRTYQNTYFIIASPDTCGYTESIEKGTEMLTSYINGNNSRKEKLDFNESTMKILKVSPRSADDEDCNKKYDILYYLPEHLQVNPPWPTNPKITLRGIKELAIYSNSILGPITDRTIEREKTILEKKLKNLGKCAKPNEYFVTTYITPGSDAIKNELWLLVDESCKTAALKEALKETKTAESLRTYSACSGRGVECPWFDQIEIHKAYEGRGYSPAKYWLTTDVKACHIDDARNLGFMRLFQYVMGENEYRSRLVMTAPTILNMRPARANTTGEQCEETFTMSYYLQTNAPPKPLNPRVYLKRIMGDVFVKVFNYTNDDSIRIALNELIRELKVDGRCYDDDEIVLAEYDQPWVPRFQTELWMFRRWCNEAEEFEAKRTDYFAIEVDDLEYFDLDYATASKFNITYEVQTDIKKPSAYPEACKKTKCAPYEMVKRYDQFEERKYAKDKWVCSRYFGCDIDSVSKRSHTEIFNYFYGEDNIKNEFMKNTAPMISKMDMSEIEIEDTSCHHDYVTCSFIPLENQKLIPEPKPESSLRIQTLESENFYVLSYGGYTHSERIKELVWQFRQILDDNQLYYKDVAYSAIYDDSRRVWKRHNEIWIPQGEAPIPTTPSPITPITGRRKVIITRPRKLTTPQTLTDELPEYI